MKKAGIAILALGLAISFCGLSMAAEKAKGMAGMSDAAKAQLVDQTKQALNSREWEVYMLIPAGKKTVTEPDVFTFANGKVSSRNLTAQGYKESNVNVGLQDDGTPVWETMQVDANNNIAFIRAEVSGSNMKGVISKQPVKGAKTTMHFTTSP
ncbi:MAG: hypothetical protein WC532_08635 [Candidatus Omnitrophota bacterium]